MNDELFQQLAASLKEGGAILRGDEIPISDARQTDFEQRAVRANPSDLADILSAVPDTPSAPGDDRE